MNIHNCKSGAKLGIGQTQTHKMHSAKGGAVDRLIFVKSLYISRTKEKLDDLFEGYMNLLYSKDINLFESILKEYFFLWLYHYEEAYKLKVLSLLKLLLWIPHISKDGLRGNSLTFQQIVAITLAIIVRLLCFTSLFDSY
ncbi:hypothetical protein PHYBLDRAFT_63651 [Phycomyces blakesleeanus NRRL 1555(-)]|uniref:Uncharacterized protein n=1 Tax=Phycomyces blakesleeanus (strain ATCC 8743b / DSM 1359 / FGSC 10004 / NBRC 33097 / NRRL 1555) TaxID=763407 RepID=A0A167K616_PHYB8|nr:hypothetical protein PHYBLDRAFT_63651 [Phycomyces blakesleeanus NRRL 1555(-)]OAD67348.1 hypothetical protein PHYBLDRAFT_63651 [Phycomyces blakesleeanus NRRL 1555(-)]|eukprot:XP_018285388.1 hypothetical protein PHYBLDRAFT_63651 [Phycomyces blakesleeanus NRRL 1555(-)]